MRATAFRLGRQTLELFARESGGLVFIAEKSGDLSKAAQKFAEELKSQYSFSYNAPLQAGNPHIKIVVHGPDQKELSVRMNVAGLPEKPADACR